MAAPNGSKTVYIMDDGEVSFTLAETVEGFIPRGLYGNSLDNYLGGNSVGNLLSGGLGNDTMAGAGGDDTYIVDSSDDVVIESAGGGYDVVTATASFTLSDHVEHLMLAGTANIDGWGNSLDNLLEGNSGKNHLYGGEGNDILNGRGGGDTMNGGTGDDYYVIQDLNDVVIEEINGGFDAAFVGVKNFDLSKLQNVEVVSLTDLDEMPTEIPDWMPPVIDSSIYGSRASNTIKGDTKDNALFGKGGKDVLTGGAGKDIFAFEAKGAATVDRIKDFSAKDDTFYLDHTVFKGLGIGKLAASAFWIGSKSHDATDRVIYNPDTGYLIFDSNGSAAGGATVFAKAGTHLKLSAADFFGF